MKREAVHHSKMKRLCRKLNLELWQGVGLLESIWHVTARQTPRGDIGKLSDEDIALSIEYRQGECAMIEALIYSGWLDHSSEFRLIVHDWPDHAEDSVHMKIARARQFFIRTNKFGDTLLEPPSLSRLTTREREHIKLFYEDWNPITQTIGVRTDNESVRTDSESVRTKQQSVHTTPPRPRLDPALTPPLEQKAPVVSSFIFNSESPSSSVREIGIALGLDDDAAGKLIAKAKQTEPTITTEELIELGRMKRSQLRGAVTNWPGLILTSIPKMLAGAPLIAARKNLNGHSKHAASEKAHTRKVAEDTINDPRSTPEERKLANELLEGL